MAQIDGFLSFALQHKMRVYYAGLTGLTGLTTDTPALSANSNFSNQHCVIIDNPGSTEVDAKTGQTIYTKPAANILVNVNASDLQMLPLDEHITMLFGAFGQAVTQQIFSNSQTWEKTIASIPVNQRGTYTTILDILDQGYAQAHADEAIGGALLQAEYEYTDYIFRNGFELKDFAEDKNQFYEALKQFGMMGRLNSDFSNIQMQKYFIEIAPVLSDAMYTQTSAERALTAAKIADDLEKRFNIIEPMNLADHQKGVNGVEKRGRTGASQNVTVTNRQAVLDQLEAAKEAMENGEIDEDDLKPNENDPGSQLISHDKEVNDKMKELGMDTEEPPENAEQAGITIMEDDRQDDVPETEVDNMSQELGMDEEVDEMLPEQEGLEVVDADGNVVSTNNQENADSPSEAAQSAPDEDIDTDPSETSGRDTDASESRSGQSGQSKSGEYDEDEPDDYDGDEPDYDEDEPEMDFDDALDDAIDKMGDAIDGMDGNASNELTDAFENLQDDPTPENIKAAKDQLEKAKENADVETKKNLQDAIDALTEAEKLADEDDYEYDEDEEEHSGSGGSGGADKGIPNVDLDELEDLAKDLRDAMTKLAGSQPDQDDEPDKDLDDDEPEEDDYETGGSEEDDLEFTTSGGDKEGLGNNDNGFEAGANLEDSDTQGLGQGDTQNGESLSDDDVHSGEQVNTPMSEQPETEDAGGVSAGEQPNESVPSLADISNEHTVDTHMTDEITSADLMSGLIDEISKDAEAAAAEAAKAAEVQQNAADNFENLQCFDRHGLHESYAPYLSNGSTPFRNYIVLQDMQRDGSVLAFAPSLDLGRDKYQYNCTRYPLADIPALYQGFVQKLTPQINYLADTLQKMLIKERSSHNYAKKGKIDVKRQISKPNTTRPFVKHNNVDNAFNTCVTCIVDMSGSMSNNNKAAHAMYGAIILAETCAKLHIPCRIVGFHSYRNTSGRPEHEHFTSWKNTLPERESLLDIPALTGGDNFDAFAITTIAEDSLKTAPADHKLVFVLSDGQPCTLRQTETGDKIETLPNGHTMSSREVETRRVVRMLKRKCRVYGIGIDHDVTPIYENTTINIKDPKQIGVTLGSYLQRALRDFIREDLS